MAREGDIGFEAIDCILARIDSAAPATPRPLDRPRPVLDTPAEALSSFQPIDCAMVDVPPNSPAALRPIGKERVAIPPPGSTEAVARVLALLRSWLRAESRDRLPNADGYVRELEMLGAEAVAAVRDANQWATYEPLIATVGLAEAFLRLCGARLASRWLGSSRPMLEESAQTWLLGNWQRCWGELSDGLKRWLVDYYSQHAGQSEQRWSGSRELLVLLGRALQSQPKADGS